MTCKGAATLPRCALVTVNIAAPHFGIANWTFIKNLLPVDAPVSSNVEPSHQKETIEKESTLKDGSDERSKTASTSSHLKSSSKNKAKKDDSFDDWEHDSYNDSFESDDTDILEMSCRV